MPRTCQTRSKKRIFGKFEPQPELDHQVPQEQGEGADLHVQGRESHIDGAIELRFLSCHLWAFGIISHTGCFNPSVNFDTILISHIPGAIPNPFNVVIVHMVRFNIMYDNP